MAGMTCVESEEMLALASLGVLSEAEAAGLESHLTACEHCRAVGRDLQRVVALLPTALEPLEPPTELRRRLLTEVYGTRRRRSQTHWWVRLWTLVPQSRALTVAGSLAVAAAIALGVWGATRAGQSPINYTVVGTTSEPQAHGTLTYLPNTQIAVVDVSGLPQPAQVGSALPDVYEVWLLAPGGPPTPAAFLTESPATHHWTATLHADISRYAEVAATAEPHGGSPQPTGPQVFSVQLTI